MTRNPQTIYYILHGVWAFVGLRENAVSIYKTISTRNELYFEF